MTNGDFEIPDYFEPEDWRPQTSMPETLYKKTALGKWIESKNEDGEVAIPLLAEVVETNAGSEAVAWMLRIRKNHGDLNLCQCQIVCECAMDMPPQEVDLAVFTCEAVEKFIRWGADEIRRKKGLDLLTGAYANIQAGLPVAEDRTVKQGDHVLEVLVEAVIKDTVTQPEEWSANRLSGSHNIGSLCHIFQQPRDRMLDLAQGLDGAEIIELSTDTFVRLRAA